MSYLTEDIKSALEVWEKDAEAAQEYTPHKMHHKFVNKDICASSEFVDKWKERPCAVVISKIFDDSGIGQRMLAQTIVRLGLVPHNIAAVIIIEASDEAYIGAKALCEGCGGTRILCDMTGKVEGVLPADSFEQRRVGNFDISGDAVVFNGNLDIVSPDTIRYYRKMMISSAETYLDTLVAEDTFMRFNTRNLPVSYYRNISVLLSLGLLDFPDRTDYPEVEEVMDVEKPEEVEVINLLSPSGFSIALTEQQETYTQAIGEAGEKLVGVRKIWQRALENTPFELRRIDTDDTFRTLDASGIKGIAEVLGVDAMLEAYLVGGVPLGDVLA